MKNLSVRLRMFFSYSILLAAALAVTLALSWGLIQRTFRETMLQSYQRELVYIMNRLQTQMSHVEDYQKSIALDNVVMDTMASHPQAPERELDFYNMNRTLRSRVTPILGTNRYIYQYIFVTLDNTFLSFRDESFPAMVEEVLGRDYFSIHNKSRGVIWNGPYEMQGVNSEPMNFFVVSKQVVDLMTLDPLGYIAFIVEEDFFSEAFEKNLPDELQVEYYLLSDEQKILSSSDKTVLGNDFAVSRGITEQDMERLQTEGSCDVREGGDTLLYSHMKLETRGWDVIYATSMDTLLCSQSHLLRMTVLTGAVACVLSLGIAFCLAGRITRPIGMLSAKMMNYYAEEGTPQTPVKISKNEIRNLYYAFDRMLENSQRMMQEIYRQQEEKSRYQFQLIQSQIRPHFLYNTLEMIKSLVDCQMYGEAGRAILAMSRFYRLSLNTGNDICSVTQEIQLARQYLYIQRLRYAEYMDYVIEDCEAAGEYCIPKLTLQPLLENSIYHGIKEKQGMGKIVLRMELTEDTLRFHVWDNGAGISPDLLQKLRQSLQEEEKKEEASIGLYSINRRIRLFFGPEFGLELESRQGEYTCITVTIPKTQKRDFQDMAQRRRTK